MKKGDFIIYDPVGMLKKIAKETEKAKQEAKKEMSYTYKDNTDEAI